jgi:hypothetical protein
MKKIFLFLFLIPIKQFQKTKMQRNILSLHENPLYIGLPAVGPGLRPVLSLDVFSANPFINKPIQLSKNIFIFVSHTNKTVSKNKDAEKYIISP